MNRQALASERQVFAEFDFVANQAIIVAQGDILDREGGRTTINETTPLRREAVELQRRRYLEQHPGERLYRNVEANAEIEANVNNDMFFYPELVLEYTPSRNGAEETFYVDFNSASARQMNEYLFTSANGVRIMGDRARRFQRGSNRHDQRQR